MENSVIFFCGTTVDYYPQGYFGSVDHDTKDLYTVEIPCKDMDDPRRKTTTTKVPMILPHELLEFLMVSKLALIRFLFST